MAVQGADGGFGPSRLYVLQDGRGHLTSSHGYLQHGVSSEAIWRLLELAMALTSP